MRNHIRALVVLFYVGCLLGFGSATYGETIGKAPRAAIKNLPFNAIPGSNEERKKAFESLSQSDQESLFADLLKRIDKAKQEAPKTKNAKGTSPKPGVKRAVDAGIETEGLGFLPLPADLTSLRQPKVRASASAAGDNDQDGLEDTFEDQLAYWFAPYYLVSDGEQKTFALFRDQVPISIMSYQPVAPPTIYYRVKPIKIQGGYAYIQINYLTLWTGDGGLVCSDSCYWKTFGLGAYLDQLKSHDWDNEHTAALVCAPSSGSYPTDPFQYSGIDYYLASHEGTFFDHSGYYDVTEPVQAGGLVPMALSLSKHASYGFNPDGFPLFPEWVIYSVYAGIYYDFQRRYLNCVNSGFDPNWCYASALAWYASELYAADTLFYTCVVEHFTERLDYSGWPNTIINVGELSPKPSLNGCYFINDAVDGPYWKLVNDYWQ